MCIRDSTAPPAQSGCKHRRSCLSHTESRRMLHMLACTSPGCTHRQTSKPQTCTWGISATTFPSAPRACILFVAYRLKHFWPWPVLHVISSFSLSETQKKALNIRNFSICTGTTGTHPITCNPLPAVSPAAQQQVQQAHELYYVTDRALGISPITSLSGVKTTMEPLECCTVGLTVCSHAASGIEGAVGGNLPT